MNPLFHVQHLFAFPRLTSPFEPDKAKTLSFELRPRPHQASGRFHIQPSQTHTASLPHKCLI